MPPTNGAPKLSPPLEPIFQECHVAAHKGDEEARLCLVGGTIYAVLVRHAGNAAEESGWYLLMGFGPCDREGMIFGNLELAAEWIREAIEQRQS